MENFVNKNTGWMNDASENALRKAWIERLEKASENYVTSPPKVTPPSEPKSIKYQIGGSHYVKMKLQPWEIIDANEIDCFYVGNVLKYLLRYKDKNGIEDLKKAQHYLKHKIELLEKQNADPA